MVKINKPNNRVPQIKNQNQNQKPKFLKVWGLLSINEILISFQAFFFSFLYFFFCCFKLKFDLLFFFCEKKKNLNQS